MVEDEALEERILDDFDSLEEEIAKITDETIRKNGMDAYKKLKELWLQK